MGFTVCIYIFHQSPSFTVVLLVEIRVCLVQKCSFPLEIKEIHERSTRYAGRKCPSPSLQNVCVCFEMLKFVCIIAEVDRFCNTHKRQW